MKNKMKIVILIPSLNPDMKLVNYVNELIINGAKNIIVVNDGSSTKYDKYFSMIKDKCVVLVHSVNQGKGRAMKTGFNYYLNNYPTYDGVVTADSDGQHSAVDTMKIASKLSKNKNSLILGCRDFNDSSVPFKSRYGNKITSLIFKLLYGKYISDTQTGLRGFSNDFIKKCLKMTGEKYDLEINMLIEAVMKKVNIIEEPIETIYINDNSSSHFNPVKDSIKIYKILFAKFLKFAFSGIFSSIVDIGLFSLFIYALKFIIKEQYWYILIATVIARIISSLVNYSLNKNVVFDSKNKHSFIKYYILVVIQMILSSTFVYLLHNKLIFNETLCKVIVDLILFFISFQIQQKIVFKVGK